MSQKVISGLNSSCKSNTECMAEIKNVRINNRENFIIATSNVNSLDSKFDELNVFGQGISDILMINETKLEGRFLFSI